MNREAYMKLAIELAKKGEGRVDPNPLVGAVIVKDGEIIAKGYHREYGSNHAELEAILDAKRRKKDLKGSELYINLEPCSHHGKTPPCCERIVREGIGKVYIGCLDPNPLVAGRGLSYLLENKVDCQVGVLEEEARDLNHVFFHHMEKGESFFALKYAMSLDGKIATRTKKSKWISNEKSREDVQRLRNKYRGILVGINTVLEDNPRLTSRMDGGRNPVIIVLDSKLRSEKSFNIFENPKNVVIFIDSSEEKNKLEKIKEFRNMGVRVYPISKSDNGLNLGEVSRILRKLNINSVLVEGGAEVNYSFLKSGLASRVYIYLGPKILGGKEALSPVAGLGVSEIEESFKFRLKALEQIDGDLRLEYGRCELVHRDN